MKSLLSILSAAVLAGLAVYFSFAGCDAFGLLQNQVMVHVDVFVLFIAILAVAASALSVLLRAMLVRQEQRVVQRLEQRVLELERASSKSDVA